MYGQEGAGAIGKHRCGGGRGGICADGQGKERRGATEKRKSNTGDEERRSGRVKDVQRAKGEKQRPVTQTPMLPGADLFILKRAGRGRQESGIWAVTVMNGLEEAGKRRSVQHLPCTA